jgi:cell wall-associated NlpC family hydrolase
MVIKSITYSLLCFLLLSSCRSFKALTAKDTSATTTTVPHKSSPKKVRFLNNISVTPGQVVTSKHVSVGPNVPVTKVKKGATLSGYDPSVPAGDIERADWLQLKYAIMLDANVEKLNNINLLKFIDEWWGTSYCMGGNTKSCIDCSAFTKLFLQSIYNVNIPRNSQEQYNYSKHIGLEDLNEGDLVFFGSGGRDVSHVGVYLLNNKFVHAATSGGVMVSDLNDNYWKGRFIGAGRVLNAAP